LIPAVQVPRPGEVGVPPEGDLAEPRPSAEGGGLVQMDVGVLVRGAVAAPVDQEQRLGGVGRRDHQRVVAPGPVIGDVHSSLAPALARSEGAVGVDERLVEEAVGLLLPGPRPGLVEDVHQPLDVALGEAATEVTGGGRVGDALGPQGVEVDLVVASDLEVFGALSACQEVVGDVQDVVALVVGRVPLEQVEVLIDVPNQPEFLGEEVDRPDPARCDRPYLLADLVADIRGRHHRPMPFDAGLVLDPAEDSPLACRVLSAETGVPPKISRRRMGEACEVPRLFAETRGFSSFSASDYAWLGTRAILGICNSRGLISHHERASPYNERTATQSTISSYI